MNSQKKLIIFSLCIILLNVLSCKFVFSQEPALKKIEYAGEFFDIKVTIENYYFVKSLLMVFGRAGAPVLKDSQEFEKGVWDELLLSYEAFRRGIVVDQQELEEEITNILNAKNAGFNWKEDKIAYEKWIGENVNEPVELFENQINHLLQVQKLRQRVTDSMQPKISDKEAYESFLDEYNSLSVELVQFEQKKDAQEFYGQVKLNPKLWDREKEKRPGDFKRPGLVSLAFLMDIWKIPKEALYEMMKMKKAQAYSPAPIYKGYAVFKVLENRAADKSKYAQLKESYYVKVKTAKRYAGWNEWLRNLKRVAKIKVYPLAQGEGGQNKIGG